MEQRSEILPGVYLHSVTTGKFKTGCFSINFLRPHGKKEAALNALLPSVLLRGSTLHPDIASISGALDELYGATVGSLVRKKGGVQMTGLYCDYIEDCYVPAGEEIFARAAEFTAELLLSPRLENGVFCPMPVEGEKRNLINAIEGQKNDKRSYLIQKLVEEMFRGEESGLPRLGEVEDVELITPESLYAHYREILASSHVEIFYMGGKTHEQAADIFRAALRTLPRNAPFTEYAVGEIKQKTADVKTHTLNMDVTQGKLAIGLSTGCGVEEAGYPALMLLNVVLGAGITSKLFVNVREKRSLCYYASSSLDKYRGIMLISSGVEFDKLEITREAILQEVDACKRGEISEEELKNAKHLALTALETMRDAPGRLDDFYLGMAICPKMLGVDALIEEIRTLEISQLVEAAQKIDCDTVFYLRGMDA